jgi:hypothetical protein
MNCILQVLTITTLFSNGQMVSVQNHTKQAQTYVQKEYQVTDIKVTYDASGNKMKEVSKATQVLCGTGEYIAETKSWIK